MESIQSLVGYKGEHFELISNTTRALAIQMAQGYTVSTFEIPLALILFFTAISKISDLLYIILIFAPFYHKPRPYSTSTSASSAKLYSVQRVTGTGRRRVRAWAYRRNWGA